MEAAKGVAHSGVHCAARMRELRASPGFDMLVQQAPLYLDFFGFPELATAARRDDAVLRALLEQHSTVT